MYWYVYHLGDYLLTPFYILVVFLIGYYVQRRKVAENPVYRYYLPGLMAKVFLSVIFLLIYTEYYGGGDTLDYLQGSYAMSKLMFYDFKKYLGVFFDTIHFSESWWFFTDVGPYPETWPPYFMWKDPNTRFVLSITSPLNLLAFRYWMPTTVLCATFSYFGVWKLYLFFTYYYPKLQKQLAVAILFVPSVVFWGSGVMKDTYTFAASSWFIFNMFQIFQLRRKILLNVILAVINVFIIVSIKPYVFVALFPGAIMWVMFNRIQRIRSPFLKTITLPMIIAVMFAVVLLVFSSMQSGLGGYGSFDAMMKQAQTIQEDLTRSEQYGGNYYDIGKIDGTFGGLMKAAPQALIAGIFRPFLWEARNPVMLISGLENFALLCITLFLMIRLKFFRFFQFMFSEPVLIFCILYSIFFLFGVGLASANFGALVRYKIPALPFFVAAIFIMLDKYKRYRAGQDDKAAGIIRSEDNG